jgi:regulator of replication initiation timing
MNTIDILKNKLNQLSQDFQFLIEENRRLKMELENLKDKNDLFTRNSEDLILTINNKLKSEDKS